MAVTAQSVYMTDLRYVPGDILNLTRQSILDLRLYRLGFEDHSG